ncbi:MAG: hypothetical protein JWN76_473 [Chitinophagaceae bacterium]|nr:hypothetical protein [Chitinophagaceae bacterium]
MLYRFYNNSILILLVVIRLLPFTISYNLAKEKAHMLFKIYEVVKSAGPDLFYKYPHGGGRESKAELLLEVELDGEPNRFDSPEEAYRVMKQNIDETRMRNRRYVILQYFEVGY